MNVLRSRIFKAVSVLTLFFLVALFSNVVLAGTAPDIIWENYFGTERSEGGDLGTILLDANGNEDGFLAVGKTSVYVNPGYIHLVVLSKVDNNGNPISGWGTEGNGISLVDIGAYEYLEDVKQVFDAQGNPDGFILSGRYDYAATLLARVDEDGTLKDGWGNNGNGTSSFLDVVNYYQRAASVLQVKDAQGAPDGFITIANYNNPPEDYYALAVIRTDGNGFLKDGWGTNGDGSSYIGRKVIGRTSHEDAEQIIRSYDAQGVPDGYIIMGKSRNYDPATGTLYGLYLAKIDNAGTALWESYIDEVYTYRFFLGEVEQTATGCRIAARFDEDLIIFNTDAQGTLTSKVSATLTFPGLYLRKIILTADGGAVITGEAETYIDSDHWGVYLAKMNAAGDIDWETVTPGSSECDWGEYVDQTADGGFIVTGYKGLGPSPNYYDTYFLRYSGCNQAGATGSVTPSQNTLWPPNHSVIPVTIDASAIVANNPDTYIRITSVDITEYSGVEAGEAYGENTYDPNNFEPDVEITGDLSLNLRAERTGPSTGRTYTVNVTATDCAGDHTFTAEVNVPHDKGQ
jgi:hypothetical protein